MLCQCVRSVATLLRSRAAVTLPSCGFSVSCQAPAKRHIIYGTEEGHDVKNEVRKERWIRKRQRRPLGGDWRESQVMEL